LAQCNSPITGLQIQSFNCVGLRSHSPGSGEKWRRSAVTWPLVLLRLQASQRFDRFLKRGQPQKD
jgi:hypothetical protein